MMYVKSNAKPGDMYHNYECGSKTSGRELYFEEDAKERGFVPCGKCRPASDDPGRGKLIPEVPPDYFRTIAKKDKDAWLQGKEEFKKEFRQSSIQESVLKVRVLEDADVAVLLMRMEELTAAGVVNQTVALKEYVGLKHLAGGASAQLAAEFKKYGDEILRAINESSKRKWRRLEEKDLLLLTWGAHMAQCPNPKVNGRREYLNGELERLQQLGHLDLPSWLIGLDDEEVEAFLTAFLGMTKRSATQFYGEMSLKQLLQGRKWSTATKEDKKRILWRLQYAHMHTFEMQAERNATAVSNGEWESREGGTLIVMDPTKCWHAGQPALRGSTMPEVLLLFQFVEEDYAAYFDVNLNTDGGFGQYPWTAARAEYMLKEAEEDTRHVSQVSLLKSS